MVARTRQNLILALALLAIAVGSLLHFVARAKADRVSLEFSETDLATVIRSIERQTWESILVAPGETRKVTINVRNLPLVQALSMLAQQTDAEWTRIYAIHSGRNSLEQLRGKIRVAGNSPAWTNYPAHGFQRPGFSLIALSENDRIDYAAAKKEATRVASDLSRFGKSLFVLENGVTQRVSMNLRDASFDESAEVLADSLHRSVARFYVLRPFFARKRPPMPPPGMQTEALPDELRKAFESGKPVQIRFEAKGGPTQSFGPGDALAPVEEMPLLPPPDPAEEQKRIQQKTLDDIRNSTPEQRLERLRRIPPQP